MIERIDGSQPRPTDATTWAPRVRLGVLAVVCLTAQLPAAAEPPLPLPVDPWTLVFPAPPVTVDAVPARAPVPTSPLGADYPFRLGALPARELARRQRVTHQLLGRPVASELDPAPNGDVSVLRDAPCDTPLPMRGPWRALAEAAGSDALQVQRALRCAFAGRSIYGDPTLVTLRRVRQEEAEPSVPERVRICGFRGAFPRCVVVYGRTDGVELSTEPDADALFQLASDPRRTDLVRTRSARGSYSLEVTRTPMTWMELHGAGCEGVRDRACDQIVVPAGMQPSGPAVTRRSLEPMRAQVLIARPRLWLRCRRGGREARLIAFAEVHVAPPQFVGDAHSAVMQAATAMSRAKPMFDLMTGEALGDLRSLSPTDLILPVENRENDRGQLALYLADASACN